MTNNNRFFINPTPIPQNLNISTGCHNKRRSFSLKTPFIFGTNVCGIDFSFSGPEEGFYDVGFDWLVFLFPAKARQLHIFLLTRGWIKLPSGLT
jgi:hypothetical protein